MPSSIPITFTARVIRGSGRGKLLGFPTINLNLDDIPNGINEGIYEGKAIIDESEYLAAIHYGPRPFFHDPTAFEVHLIDTRLTKLPYEMTIKLAKRIRNIKNFSNEQELKIQISKDIESIKLCFEMNLTVSNQGVNLSTQ